MEWGVRMNKETEAICDLTVDNYRELREDFRFDGDYINHFAAIIYANIKRKIPTDSIKKIRTYIKENTSRMSYFRGDILYMISFLICMEHNPRIFSEVLLETYDELIEKGLKESKYLVLAAYALVKHTNSTDTSLYMDRMKEIFETMKLKHTNIINEEDYLECALLAINNCDKDIVNNYMDNIFNSLLSIEDFSRNSIQGLTLALLLNKNSSSLIRIEQLLLEFKEKDIKVSYQFLPFLAVSAGNYIPQDYSNKVIEVSKYLCDSEYEYEYYMDSSFRAFIAVSLLEFSTKHNEERYLNELLTMGVYSFIVSKNQSIISESLA